MVRGLQFTSSLTLHIRSLPLPVEVTLDQTATVASGGLTGTYKAVQFHFHWGNNESRGTAPTVSSGSEHSIDGERYAMEVKGKQEFRTRTEDT